MDANKDVKLHCDTCNGQSTVKHTMDNGNKYVLECGHTAVPEHKKYGP